MKIDEFGDSVGKGLIIKSNFYDDPYPVHISQFIVSSHHISWTWEEGSHRGLDYFIIFYSSSGIVRMIELRG
jgi:hypothetical protein